MPEPKVMPPPSSSADSDDEEEQAEHSWAEQVRHMWSSPLMATACCIFLCYILKVLQQVPAPTLCPSHLPLHSVPKPFPPSRPESCTTPASFVFALPPLIKQA